MTMLRGALVAIGVGLGAGLALHGLGLAQGDWLITAALAALVAIPVVNVLAVLVQETGRRHWGFAFAALAILVELAFALKP